MDELATRAVRAMYQSDLPSFLDFAARILCRKYEPHWSTFVLGSALARCFSGETKRLIINLPPRSLKSICCSAAFPACILALRPEAKILSVAGHRGLADDHHALTRTLMLHERYRSLFPHVRFSETASKISLPQGGSRSAFTPNGA